METPEYLDQDGNVVPLCVRCKHWRAVEGDYCETCAAELEADMSQPSEGPV